MEITRNQTFFRGTYLNLTAYLFLSEYIKKLQWLSKSMETMMQNQIFFHQIWDLFWSKHIKIFQCLSKSKFLNFMTKVNPNNGNKTNSDIFPMDIFKSDIIFIGRKILKYFNDFYNFQSHYKSKRNHTEHAQIWQYFFYLQKSALPKCLLKFISW